MIKEYGFKELCYYVFDLIDVSETNLSENLYFISNKQISEAGLQEIVDFLKSGKLFNSIDNATSLSILTAICSLSAYGNYIKDKDLIEKIIKDNCKNIFNELNNILKDEFICDKTLNFDIFKKDSAEILCAFVYDNIIKQEYQRRFITYELIDNCYNVSLYGRQSVGGNLFHKDNNLFGINQLLKYLCKFVPKSFDNWFFDTKRIDLQIISVYVMMIDNYFIKEHFTSKIPFLRSTSILTQMLHTNIRTIDLTIEDVSKLDINDKEKILLILFSLDKKYGHRVFIKDNEEFDRLHKDIKTIDSFLNKTLDLTVIEELVSNIKIDVLIISIYVLQDSSKKSALCEPLINFLEEKLSNIEYLLPHDLDYADRYKIILDIDEENCFRRIDSIIEKFDKLYKEISEPYFYYRKNKNWDNDLFKMLYYLRVSLFLYKSNNKVRDNYREQFLEMQNKFLSVKQDHIKIGIIDLEPILEQILL